MPHNGLEFDTVRAIALALPSVEENKTSRGASLRAGGNIMACPAIHKSAEPNSLMVRISKEQRTILLSRAPRIYYLTDHYAKYPAVLVRLSQISKSSLQELLKAAWDFAGGKGRYPQ